MHITIFHYHLLPGGVTQVILSSAVSILKYIPEITGITLVSGREENTKNVLAGIRNRIPLSINKEIKVEIVQELQYLSEQSSIPDTNRMTKILTERFAPGVWWIHNFHLGKNPVFTKSLLTIAETRKDVRMVLQIHDFPECGRFQNINALGSYIHGHLYPQSNNVRYAVINNRDKLLLAKAGIHKESIFLLDNPVEKTEPLPFNSDTYKRIESFFSGIEPSYIPGAPILIYPVRSIRRKNTLEAGLLSRLLSRETNLFVTLPGTSESEKEYSNMVDYAFKENLIHGVFASGLKGQEKGFSFLEQVAASTGIISSAVQEGFGYLYINALQWGKPLFARYLDILVGTEQLFEHQQARFYREVKIPVSLEEKNELLEKYKSNFKRVSAIYPGLDVSDLSEELEVMLKEKFIDFSYLSPKMQLNTLKKLNDIGFLSEIRIMNKELLAGFEEILSPNYKKREKPDLERFSLLQHAATIKKILFTPDPGVKAAKNSQVSSNLLALFTKIEYLKLLYSQ